MTEESRYLSLNSPPQILKSNVLPQNLVDIWLGIHAACVIVHMPKVDAGAEPDGENVQTSLGGAGLSDAVQGHIHRRAVLLELFECEALSPGNAPVEVLDLPQRRASLLPDDSEVMLRGLMRVTVRYGVEPRDVLACGRVRTVVIH